MSLDASLVTVLGRGSHGPLVTKLQNYFNRYENPQPKLKVDGDFGKGTEDAVRAFSKKNDLSTGMILFGHESWKIAGRKIGFVDILTDSELPLAVKAVMLLPPTQRIEVYPEVFLPLYRTAFGSGPTQQQRQGLTTILQKISQDSAITDVRWAAYMLATVKLETAHTFNPIPEDGCNDANNPVCTPVTLKNGNVVSRSYGNHKPCPNLSLKPPLPCPNGKQTHTYYGRGYVQITGKDNYKNLGHQIGLGDQLVHAPERALDPDVAYSIMSAGMTQGLFTGDSLSDHINNVKCDYKNARKIINPADTGTYNMIAGYAEKFQAMLEASQK
jgi:putative chitinase